MEINNKSKRKQTFEKAQYFLELTNAKPIGKKVKKLDNNQYLTLRDSLITNFSTIGTKETNETPKRNELNINPSHTKNNSIKINKKLIKYAEPRLKLQSSVQIPQKFSSDSYNRNSLINSISNDNHLVETDNDLLEIDEKLPQSKLELIEAKKSIIVQEEFNFSILVQIEKIYEELANDFNGNGLNNVSYKEKLGSEYFDICFKEDNNISSLFEYNKEINKFLFEELTFYLVMMNLGDLDGLSENELMDLKTLLSYLHFIFLHVMSMIINNYKSIEQKDQINYEKCCTIIEINSKKIDDNKFSTIFDSKNKIIKQLIQYILSIIKGKNDQVVEIIKKIFSYYKTKKFSHIRWNIKQDQYLNNKFKLVFAKSNLDPEIKGIEDSSEDLEDELNEKNKPIPPFLPEKKSDDKREYTLVLDLDETLVHYFEDEKDESAYVKVRMGTENFIQTLSEYCEIVIFTASTQYYADIVIDGLDSKDKIDYRLYREHTTVCDGINIKDLGKLGRDIKKMIIIDNIEDNYQLQPKNGLNIISFEGDEKDCELQYLLNDLLEIVSKKGLDVRDHLDEVRKKMKTRYGFF